MRLRESSIFLEDALQTEVAIAGYQLHSKLPSFTSTAIVCAKMEEIGNPAMTPCLMDILLLMSMPLPHSKIFVRERSSEAAVKDPGNYKNSRLLTV